MATQEQPASQTSAAVAMSSNADNKEKELVISNYWEVQYQQLLHFQNGYGHCWVPVRYTHVPSLGRWVEEQHVIYRLNPTPEPRWATKFNDIGFECPKSTHQVMGQVPTARFKKELKEFQ
jgi:hypothetical protein